MAAEPPQDGTSSLNSQDAADLEKELNGAAISNTSSLSPQAHLRLQQEIMAKADASIAGALSRQARVGHYKLTLELFFAHCTSGANPLAVESPTIDQATENRIRGTGAARPYNAYQPVVVIPFETSDLPRNRNLTKRALRRFFFGQDAMSVRTYFVHNSYFNYGLREGSISDWVQLPKSISEYNTTAPEADWTRDPAPLRGSM